MLPMQEIVAALRGLFNLEVDTLAKGFDEIVSSNQSTHALVLNAAARHVAYQYLKGRMSFEDGIVVTTVLFWASVSRGFVERDSRITDMWNVFLAFDGGTIYREGEEVGDPELRCTRPDLEDCVRAWEAA